ncbi:MAG: hypothetical protein ACJ8F1_02125 [Polyangia bacterium]
MTAPRCALVLAVTMAACGSSGSTTGTTNGNVTMTDQNNYTSMSTLNLPVVQTKAAADLSISWPDVMKDLLCHPAASIDNVAFLKVPNMSKEQIQTALAEGTLAASQVSKYYEWHTAGATSAMLSSLKFGGAIDVMNDYTESATTQYLLLFTHGTVQGVGAQSMLLLQPTAASTNTTVTAPDACASKVLATFVPTFGTPLSVPAAGPYTVDWSKLTKDSFGHAIQFQTIDQVEVAYYQGKQTSDLMAHFLDVEIDATSLYAAKLSGQKSFDLKGATTTSGTAFSGFSQTDGTWALALRCSTCSVPAPVAFTILQPQ